MIFLPFIISSLTGILLLRFLLRKDEPLNWPLQIFLGIGLGLGVSSYITFFSFLFLDHLNPGFIITSHVLLLGGLLAELLFNLKERKLKFTPPPLHWIHGLIAASTLLIVFLVVKQGAFYPYGGWDAWQVWNFKAKFLTAAGDHWKNLFSPQLWRSSPHYPLLLPLINVWGWLFTDKPIETTPLITSLIFTFVTAGTLISALWERSRSLFSFLPGLLLLTLPFFDLLATTQYCDIVLSFYLLSCIVTLTLAGSKEQPALTLLAGIFAGFLGFSKPEGLIAALILCALIFALTVWNKIRQTKYFYFAQAGWFMLGFAVFSLPSFAFKFLYSPGNQTFVNGLSSALKPSTVERFQVILVLFFQELISGKWNGLWILIAGGVILGWKKPWSKNNILTAAFLFLYMAVILFYYQVNTYFEIKWWISVSLNRILFSLLPLALFWVFNAHLSNKKKN